MPKRPGAYLVVFVYTSLPFCHHITMSSSSCPCHLDHERLLAAAKQHLEQNKKARLRMARCVAFSYIRLRVPIAHIGSVLISSYVHLRSKSGLPSALECIKPGIGKRIIKQCFVENPNAGARFTSNGTGRERLQRLCRTPRGQADGTGVVGRLGAGCRASHCIFLILVVYTFYNYIALIVSFHRLSSLRGKPIDFLKSYTQLS
ncbi:hypothetical protein B0H14DRAFT_3152460 [Mycena olivaceomarginata]|nr:hypothetical protein B0H14DRAFT_3152460 [Mycena olivaceomarginata]